MQQQIIESYRRCSVGTDESAQCTSRGKRRNLVTLESWGVAQRHRPGCKQGSVHHVIAHNGGVMPHIRRRSRWQLSLAEREEISRGLAVKMSLRAIALKLGRALAISREVARHGGKHKYRAAKRAVGRGRNDRSPACWLVMRNSSKWLRRSSSWIGLPNRFRAGLR